MLLGLLFAGSGWYVFCVLVGCYVSACLAFWIVVWRFCGFTLLGFCTEDDFLNQLVSFVFICFLLCFGLIFFVVWIAVAIVLPFITYSDIIVNKVKFNNSMVR